MEEQETQCSPSQFNCPENNSANFVDQSPRNSDRKSRSKSRNKSHRSNRRKHSSSSGRSYKDRRSSRSTSRESYIEKLVEKKVNAALKGEKASSKTPKSSAEIEWRNRLNKEQFVFNETLSKELKLLIGLYEHGGEDVLRQAKFTVEKLLGTITERQKLIQIADRSTYGWATAHEYQKDPLATDPEDERRMRSADFRAGKKRKTSINRFSRVASQNQTTSGGWQSSFIKNSGVGQRNFFAPVFPQQRVASGRRGGNQQSEDACFNCGKFGHWQSKCPTRPYYNSNVPRKP